MCECTVKFRRCIDPGDDLTYLSAPSGVRYSSPDDLCTTLDVIGS